MYLESIDSFADDGFEYSGIDEIADDDYSQLSQGYPQGIPECFPNYEIMSMAPEFEQYHQPQPEQHYTMQQFWADFY